VKHPDTTHAKRTENRTRFARWYWIPMAVVVLGVLSMAMLIWVDWLSQRQRADFALANAVMDFRIRISAARLNLQEATAGKTGIGPDASVRESTIAAAMRDFREARRLSEVLLNGGVCEGTLIVEPPTDPEHRRWAEGITQLVSNWGMIIQERYERPEVTLAATVLDGRGDAIYRAIQSKAAAFESKVEEAHSSGYTRHRLLILGILVAWSFVVTVATGGVLHQERRRRRAERALRSAHDELEARVQERTAELATAVDTLRGEVSERKRAEGALQSLFDGVPVGLFRTTPAGQILAVNPALVQTLGYPDAQTLMRLNAADIYVEGTDRQRWQHQVERDGHIRDAEIRVRRQDGTPIWVRMSTRATRAADGRVLHYEGVLEDITAERLAGELRNRLAAIVETSLDAISSETLDGTIFTWNRGAERIYGYPAAEAVGATIALLIPPDLAEELPRLSEALRHGQRIEALETVRVRKDGQRIHVALTISPILDATGTMVGSSTIARDITERRHSEDALRKLSTALEQTADLVWITDRDGVIEYVNPAFEQQTGYALDEVRGKTLNSLKSESTDRRVYEELWQTIVSGKVFRHEFLNRRKDGTLFYLTETITPIAGSDGQITHFVATGRDSTERREAMAALQESREQLRALAAHLESVREEERTRMAREIHDELGQALTGLRIDLSWLATKLQPQQAALADRIAGMREQVDGTIRTVRRLATELRPGVLDALGLVAAMEWQAQEFQARTGIRCEFVSHVPDAELDREQSTALFRILQEALTNVARHAGASGVRTSLEGDADSLVLVVKDNGRGIAESEINSHKSLGLLGIRERVHLLGGSVCIVGSTGSGTTVTVKIPLRRSAEETP